MSLYIIITSTGIQELLPCLYSRKPHDFLFQNYREGVYQLVLNKHFEQYAQYLREREGMKIDVARRYAERLQAFFESEKTALEYAEELRKKNFDWANTFVNNYGL